MIPILNEFLLNLLNVIVWYAHPSVKNMFCNGSKEDQYQSKGWSWKKAYG